MAIPRIVPKELDPVHHLKVMGRFVRRTLKKPGLPPGTVVHTGTQKVERVRVGYLDYDPAGETYALPEEHAYFLASDETDHFVGGLFVMVPPLMRIAPEVARAFAEGGGVPFEAFGPECVEALELINGGQYEARFADYWMRSVPQAAERLRAGGRALDVGCGSGRVCIALARAFPKAEIVGGASGPSGASTGSGRNITSGRGVDEAGQGPSCGWLHAAIRIRAALAGT